MCDLKLSAGSNEERLWKPVLRNTEYWFQVDTETLVVSSIEFIL